MTRENGYFSPLIGRKIFFLPFASILITLLAHSAINSIGECYEISITDISSSGEGIGKINGIAVFIPDAIPGDIVLAKVIELRKNFAGARLKHVLSFSQERRDPPCAYAEYCGGCSFQSLNYESQISYKKKWVVDCLERIGQLDSPRVKDIIEMKNPWRYRNNVQYSIEGHNIGFYKKSSHETINCVTCLLQPKPVEKIVQAIREYINGSEISVYDKNTGKGTLRRIVIRTAFGTGEMMVTLIATKSVIPDVSILLEKIKNAVKGINEEEQENRYCMKSLILNINTDKKTEGLGRKNIVLAGNDRIRDRLAGMEFEISPDSFYQVNSLQTEKLYEKVKEYASLTGKETILDLYCGIGTIGLTLARDAKRIIGIESIGSAVADANRNAYINGIKNSEFIHGKAEVELPMLISQGITADIVILDPPRAGCNSKLLDAVSLVDPKRIIYVSCNPATLARDIKILTQKGFQFVEAQPVDMFPWTGHVEAIILLQRAER